MIPLLLKLNEDTVKEVQKVLDKYEIDFNYLEYLQKKSKDFKTARDWYYGFQDTEIELYKIKNYEKYDLLNLKSNTTFMVLSDGTFSAIKFPQIDTHTCAINLSNDIKISSVEDLDLVLSSFFKTMDKCLNLCKTEKYQNIFKNIKEKEDTFKQMIEKRNIFIEKSYREVKKLVEINEDF